MANNSQLAWHDLQWCLKRCPASVLELLKKHPDTLFVAGGFIRSCVTNERINDIDLFAPSKDIARQYAEELAAADSLKTIYETDNAFTVKLKGRVMAQFIHRWTFSEPYSCIESFDFTIACAAFWWHEINYVGGRVGGEWRSLCDDDFYADLAGKRLVYRSPVRNEDAGGSMLRVLKFYQRGYRIPLDSLAAVIARLNAGVKEYAPGEHRYAKIVCGLLREVDPDIDPHHVAHLSSRPETEIEVLDTDKETA